jgi:hypothetical protein
MEAVSVTLTRASPEIGGHLGLLLENLYERTETSP